MIDFEKVFSDLDIKFKSVKIDVDESYPKHLKAEQITDFLADKKSES